MTGKATLDVQARMKAHEAIGFAKKRAVRRVSILGATGSIGDSTIDLILRNPDLFEVVALTGGTNVSKLIEIAKKTRPQVVAIADESKVDRLKEGLLEQECTVLAGDCGIVEAAEVDCDMMISAIVGFAGLRPTLAALDHCDYLALANKESLVCAGGLVQRQAQASGTMILPLDSEHNAIAQSLHDEPARHIEKIIITASGGPFRTWTKEEIAKASAVQALKHPNWSMGSKITIDSATLMNKGLEVIEAYHLFPVGHDQLEVVVHPQSIIHGMVSFIDGAVVAELGTPDMRMAISHCLNYPERLKTPVERLNLAKIGSLTFEEPDLDRFPNLRLALDAMAIGDRATNLLNAANEVAVNAFLADQIGFYQMSRLIETTMEEGLKRFGEQTDIRSFEEVAEIDHFARIFANGLMVQNLEMKAV